MLACRNLTESDCDFILAHWVGDSVVFRGGLSRSELSNMIQQMNTKTHNGRYYEIFGIVHNTVLVGTFSFYQREIDFGEAVVYMGIEISSQNRRKGFATQAIPIILAAAKGKGYKEIYTQVRVDNIASVHWHKRNGFTWLGESLSAKGHKVYNYMYAL